MSLLRALANTFAPPKLSPEHKAALSQMCECIGGPFDGTYVRAGTPGQSIVMPHRPDWWKVKQVASKYYMRHGAWRFMGFVLERDLCGE